MLDTIRDFLAQKRIAVVGVSRNPKDFNTRLFLDLRQAGYDAVPVNPHAKTVGDVPCFDRVQAISPPVDGVLILTPATTTEAIVRDCLAAGVRRVWMYRAVGLGAVNQSAIALCEKNGVRVVAGGCPYMFLPNTQWFHRLHGFLLKLVGKYPSVSTSRP
jgi:predicted CoA-binding protein